jgi:leader peptidase (prepilin peptidase)/N-methyltransferase
LSRFFDLHFGNLAWAAIIASPVIGSFLGLAIERLPAGRTILWGRSQCDICGHTLGPRDLVPFASWILSGGRCRYCRTRLSVFYPLIEIAALLVAVWSATATAGVRFLASCVIGWLLLVAAAIDWRKRGRFLIPVTAIVVWLVWLYAPVALSH